MIRINSKFKSIDFIGYNVHDNDIKDEPMFYSADLKFAYEHGGPITKDFIDNIPAECPRDGVLDSRVHMLMPGMYPCIPGWHCDDLIRENNGLGQPIWTADNPAEHIICVIGKTSLPEFIFGEVQLPENIPGFNTYELWNLVLERNVPREIKAVMSGELVHFKGNSGIHRGTEASVKSWRIFLRYSYNTPWKRGHANEIRKQVQVYTDLNKGW